MLRAGTDETSATAFAEPRAPRRGGFAAVVLTTTASPAPTLRFSLRAASPTELRPAVDVGRAGRAALPTSTASRYVGVGVAHRRRRRRLLRGVPARPTERTLRSILLALIIGVGGHRAARHRSSGGGRAGRLLRPLEPRSPTPPARSPPAASTPASSRRGRPRPRPPRRLVQRHGRRGAGAHRARGPLRVRRQPRAALADHRPGRRRRGASTPAAASCPTAPSRRSTSSSARCAASTPW